MDIAPPLPTASRINTRDIPLQRLNGQISRHTDHRPFHHNSFIQPVHTDPNFQIDKIHKSKPEPQLIYPGLNTARRGMWMILEDNFFPRYGIHKFNGSYFVDSFFINPHYMVANRLLIQSASYILSHWNDFGFRLSIKWDSVSDMRGFFERYRTLPFPIFKKVSSLGYVPTLIEFMHFNSGNLNCYKNSSTSFLQTYSPPPFSSRQHEPEYLDPIKPEPLYITKSEKSRTSIHLETPTNVDHPTKFEPEPIVYEPSKPIELYEPKLKPKLKTPRFTPESAMESIFGPKQHLKLHLKTEIPVFKGELPSISEEISDQHDIRESVDLFLENHEKSINSIQKTFFVDISRLDDEDDHD